MDRETTIEITHRFPDGRPRRGTAIFPDFSHRAWERSEQGELMARQDPDRPEKFWLDAEQRRHLRRALAKDSYEAEARLARRGEKAAPWPLERLPKPGERFRFGNREFLNPLSAAGHAMACDIRKAALEGDNFRSMMVSIREAGFDILPQIRQRDDGAWSYSGIGFSRDGQHLSASQARLMIVPTPGQDRAPVLSEDGPWLVELREAYLEKNQELVRSQIRLRAEIKEIVAASGSAPRAAENLREAGFTALPEHEDRSLMRSSWTVFRDGVGVELSWKMGRSLMTAARHLSRLEPAPAPEPASASPHP